MTPDLLDFTEFKRQELARHLRRQLQGEVRFDHASRQLYSTDASIYRVEPLGVIIPKTLADLQTAVQIAGEMRIPITARGGGTSLSGQSIGPGVVVDCSKYLNRVLSIDPTARSARVQPGVVLDQLNRAAAQHDLFFGPEVATATRANLGGMIGNNSAGSRSIIYGKTIDHVRRLNVLLSDGKPASFGPVSGREWEARAEAATLEGRIYRGLREVVQANAGEIERRFPRIVRRVSGYNLEVLRDGFAGGGEVGIHQLLVGSEGTLGFTTEAELNLLPRPKARGLLVPHYASLAAALATLDICLESNPSAVELVEQMILDFARDNLSLKSTMGAIRGRPAAVFMVEFVGDSQAEIADRVEKLQRRLQHCPGVTALVPALDPALREPLWNLRSAGMPLLYGLPGDRKPITFIEDCAVAPEKLPEFVERFTEILQRHGTHGAYYGHASVGCLHIRPLLNLKDQNDVATMRRIMEEVTDLVLDFGGSLSGEHGDGLVRSEWNQKMFGPVVYEAFRQVKGLFDPDNLLNPGKVVNAPSMTENLRYGPHYRPAAPETLFDYSKQEGFIRSIEMCNGNGACRKQKGGTMCPSFRATLDEKDNTRGRANALRLAMSGDEPLKELRSQWVYDVLDLCLMCKACKAECPSNVDLAKLKSEFLHFYYQGRPRPVGQWLMARIYRMNQLGAPAAPLVNWMQRQPLFRWFLEKSGGIDRRRSLPPLASETLRRWFARHKAPAIAGHFGKVLLLDDCFATFNEPAVGKAAVRVLEQAGHAVELAGLTCCARPMISKGFLPEARALIQAQAPRLARRLADGVALVGLEPSCLLALVDEWPELVPGPDTRRIAAAAKLADGWLADEAKAGRCAFTLRALPESAVLHGHCHQKALVGLGGTTAALKLVPQLDVTVLDTGCCGMAGSFGYEKEHYDLSVQVANLELLPALKAAPEATVIAPGTSCRHQIHDLAGRHAKHPMEVLAEALERNV